ncbi:MAG: entericidin EcnAB [Sulfurovum sp.]
MNKSVLFLMVTLFAAMTINGCATWHGVKKDTTQVWNVATS